MRSAEFLALPTLLAPGVRHAFFTRNGGVSEGLYASLNGGVGSCDAAEAVAENRARMAEVLGVARGRLLVPFQVHSADAIAVSAPWDAVSGRNATASSPRRAVSRSASPARIAA